jgi:hypothetical protein
MEFPWYVWKKDRDALRHNIALGPRYQRGAPRVSRETIPDNVGAYLSLFLPSSKPKFLAWFYGKGS